MVTSWTRQKLAHPLPVMCCISRLSTKIIGIPRHCQSVSPYLLDNEMANLLMNLGGSCFVSALSVVNICQNCCALGGAVGDVRAVENHNFTIFFLQ